MNQLTRRDLLRSAGMSTAFLTTTPFDKLLGRVVADDAKTDSLPMQLYKSMSEAQRQKVCLPMDHPRRQYVSNWWYIQPEHHLTSQR